MDGDSEPWGIVVVPTEAGRALLKLGPCCSFPPLVIREWPPSARRWSVAAKEHRHERAPDDEVSGLPLWWGGAPVPEGVFRAWQMWDPDATPEAEAAFEATGWTTYDVLGEALDGASGAEWLARALETAGPCRVVLLDLVDGAVVERAP